MSLLLLATMHPFITSHLLTLLRLTSSLIISHHHTSSHHLTSPHHTITPLLSWCPVDRIKKSQWRNRTFKKIARRGHSCQGYGRCTNSHIRKSRQKRCFGNCRVKKTISRDYGGKFSDGGWSGEFEKTSTTLPPLHYSILTTLHHCYY